MEDGYDGKGSEGEQDDDDEAFESEIRRQTERIEKSLDAAERKSSGDGTLRSFVVASQLTAGLPPEVQEASAAMLDNMLKGPDESAPVPDDITLADGLLSPNGEWYSVTYGLHKEMARRIWKTLHPDDPLDSLTAEERLDELGWIKVGHYITSPDKLREVMHSAKAGPVTEPQRETLQRWSEKYATEFRWNSDKVTYRGWLALLREE